MNRNANDLYNSGWLSYLEKRIMKQWLQQEWFLLASNYSKTDGPILEYWKEIEAYYSKNNRHYHNLSHITNMLLQAEYIKDSIVDYDAFRFAIWYHDIIYKAVKKNNEKKSAEFSTKRLKSFGFEEKRRKIVENSIKSTQKHDILLPENDDNAYLLDLDLSILGTKWEVYDNYIKNIRKEYSIYPDILYNEGRKKIMLHFLERKHIYFTELYYNKFEKQARLNIQKEINLL